MYKIKISPKFSTQEIMNDTLKKDWFIFQNEAFELGQKLTSYMQNYINNNRHRAGGTGNLANAITFEGKTGTGFIKWGIGNISILNRRAKYWYVLNFGKYITGQRFRPGHKSSDAGNPHFIRGIFADGTYPNSGAKGHGSAPFAQLSGGKTGMIPGVIRPINYIQATQHKFGRELSRLLAKIRRSI